MAEFFTRCEGAPEWEALPVSKLVDYPLEKGSYKPFAQGQLALGDEALFVRLWAFETPPDPESRLGVAFSQGARSYYCALSPAGELACFFDGRPTRLFPQRTPLAGEDLQGVYWGGVLRFPLRELRGLLGEEFARGDTLVGNLYKTSASPLRPHHGSLFPVDWSTGDPYAAQSHSSFFVSP